MGGADVVPGVSGGTVALVLGIYEHLVTAISRVDRTLLRFLVAGRFREAAEYVDLFFLCSLACGIFTGDVGRAHRLAKSTRAGIVWVNTYRVVSPIAEFGGFKDSGYGRESGAQAIYDYTRPKTVWINTSPEPMANPFVMR